MKIQGKTCVITGAARGIGAALARRFKAAGAAAIVVADMDQAPLAAVAAEIGGLAVPCDVTREADIDAQAVSRCSISRVSRSE